MKIESKKKKLKVVLMGLGRVGASDDFTRPPVPRTHLSAILDNKNLELVGLVDPDRSKFESVLKFFPEISGAKYYKHAKYINHKIVDIIVLSGPTDSRVDQLISCVKLKPSFVLMEKPLSLKLEDALQIKKIIKVAGVYIGLNYMKRFSPILSNLFANARDKIISITCKYSGGFFNNGTHLFDIVNFYCGEIKFENVIGQVSSKLTNGDILLDFVGFTTSGIKVHFMNVGETDYHINELDLYYENKRISLLDNCTRKIEVVSKTGSVFPNYSHLDYNNVVEERNIDTGFSNIYSAIVHGIKFRNNNNICTFNESLKYIEFGHFFKKT